MKCPKCENIFEMKDVAEDVMEREINNLYFECPKCDTPLVMSYTLQED